MPIREADRNRYPKNWRVISERIRDRAGQRCECTGQCGDSHSILGRDRCNAPNGILVLRHLAEPWRWCTASVFEGATLSDAGEWARKAVKIVLTVAHLDHTPEHCEPENLLAMCQRCHLRMDAEQHQHNAHETRRQHKAAGELPGLE